MARSKLGSLVVEIAADVASLKTDMDRARSTVENALGGMTKAASIAKGALGGLGVAVSVAKFTDAIRDAIDFGDRLKDLATATGATVEQLSFLDFAAKQNGSSLDSLSSGLAKLQRNLGDVIAGGGDKAAEALKRLNLSAKDLAGQNVLQQLTAIGDGLAKIENPAQRAQAAQALFGKGVQELLPLLLSGGDNLQKLVDRFVELNGTVTKDQASKFDDFNDAIAELGIASRGTATAIGEALVPSLTKLTRALADAIGKDDPVDKLTEKANSLRETIKTIEAQISAGSLDPLNKSFLVPDVKLKPEAIEALKRNLQGYRTELAATLREQVKLLADANTKRDAILAPPPPAPAEDVNTDAAIAKADAERERRLREELRISGEVLNQHLRDIDEESRYWDEREKHKQQLRQSVETTPERVLRELKDFQDAFGSDSIEFGRRAAAAYDELLPPIKEATNAGKELGLVFSSAFEDAIAGGKDLLSVIQSLGQDIVKMVTRNLITNPLSDVIGGLFKSDGGGSGIGSFLSKMFGGARASGGPVSPGSAYLVGESGRELFMPNVAGTIIPNAALAAGGGVTVNIQNFSQAPVKQKTSGVGTRRQVDIQIGDSMARNVADGRGVGMGLRPPLAGR